MSAPPEAVWPLGPGERERATGPNTVCVLERDVEADGGLPVAEARVRFRTLLTAMRLLKPGRVAFGAPAWGRSDEGAWKPITLTLGGPGRGEPWLLSSAECGELAELTELVAAARLPGRIGWALHRFELGCERPSEAEAISDYLLALRGMLDAEDEAGRASLGLRLAALCAEEPGRRQVRARLDDAFAIEREAMGGAVFDPDDAEGPAIVHEIEQHLRALLRDVVCGYLSGDLRSVADDILVASADPIEIHAHDTRDEPQLDLADEPPPLPEEREPDEPDPDPDRDRIVRTTRAGDGPGTAADPRSSAWRVATRPGPRSFREAPQASATGTVVVDEATIADEPLPVPEAAHLVEEPTAGLPQEPTAAMPDPLAPAAEEPTLALPAEPEPAPQPSAEPEEPTSRIAALDGPEPEGVDDSFAAGVTPSADWGDDDDCWSAPV